MSKRIPATILSGYLGAGKTTVINALLRNIRGRRIAVLVNDFGAINIDADLIESQADQTISLKNGCVCCSIADDLGAALTTQVQRPDPPDHLVIEASGVSQPARIASHVGGWPGVELCKVVTVIDPLTVRQRLDDKYVGSLVQRQITAADLLLLNKTDLIDGTELARIRALVIELAGGTDLLCGANGEFPTAPFFTAAKANVPADETQDHELTLHSAIWQPDAPVDVPALMASLSKLPECVHRIKGFVCDVTNKQTVLVQKTGDQITQSAQDSQKEAHVVIFSADRNYDPRQVIDVLKHTVVKS